MKKVLLVTDVNFWEKSSGNRARIYSLVQYLSSQVQLTVVNTGPAPQHIEDFLSKKFTAEFFVLENTKYLNSNGYGRRLKAFLKGKHFDTIIIEYIHSSYFLNFLTEDTRIILDAHDIISHRAEEFKKFNYPGALYELSGETEAEILSVYDNVMVLCQADADLVNAMTGPGKALLCPHPVEPRSHPQKNIVKNIAFVASGYLPNKDAIEWFIANCWPAISAKYDVTLSIYGTVCSALIPQAQTNVVYKGFVPDSDQIYEEADLIINPVRFGAGLKIKNMEALAHGIPLVTTTHGARGIETGINQSFLVADDAGGFIRAIGSLIENPELRQKLGESAHQLIEKRFSAAQCFEPLLEAIQKA